MLKNGERQVASELSGIRRDHVARYEYAARLLPVGSRVVDFACGVGYGAKILADAGHEVLALDRSGEAISYAREHYGSPRIVYSVGEIDTHYLGENDAAVCFETLEHLQEPIAALRLLRASAPMLICSVPNEDVLPFQTRERRIMHHFRHYTRAQFGELLENAGYRVTGWLGQQGPLSEVDHGMEGRTLIAVAERAAEPAVVQPEPPAVVEPAGPKTVVILGLGPSLEQYVDQVKRRGGRRALADEIWGINSLGDVLACDRVFHMDDVRIQEMRAAANPGAGIDVMLQWLRQHSGPVVTSRAHPDYPGLVEFPLEAVINKVGYAYFNSTAAYAVAYAIFLGVKKILLYGIDFTYADAHHAEKGRGCVEFWLGLAAARGIEIAVAQLSTLMDANVPQEERLYGYDTLDVTIAAEGNVAKVTFKEREKIPTAEEIEDRYDHSKHPAGELAGQEAA
jgi:hypothetical protein